MNTDMKKTIRTLVTAAFFVAAPVVLMAQMPPHPNGGNAPGSGNVPVGGGTPIDGGLSIMLVMGAAYASRKIFQLKK
jgi:hypothetical protein